MKRARQATICIVVAWAIGLLELAWGADTHGPERIEWGLIAIFTVFFVLSWPSIWWIPALAVFEEWGTWVFWPPVHAWHPVWSHWSVAYLGVNIYPWIVFPVLTVAGEIAWRLYCRKRGAS